MGCEKGVRERGGGGGGGGGERLSGRFGGGNPDESQKNDRAEVNI